jgi:hypothetical protein
MNCCAAANVQKVNGSNTHIAPALAGEISLLSKLLN